MSDGEQEDEKPFAVERAKTGRAKCKKCKCPIDKDQVRIAKLMANPFGEGKMKAWHHVSCLFEVFSRQRASTKRIENPEEDISGWDSLCDEDKDVVLEKLGEFEDAEPFKAAKAKAKSPKATPAAGTSKKNAASSSATPASKVENSAEKKKRMDIKTPAKKKLSKDDMFSEFQRICDELANHPSYLEKTAIVKKMFTKGSEKDGFKSDIILWCRLLLPGAVKRIYNLQSKALIKLFARVLCQDEDAMLEDLEQGDVAQTIKTFFEGSITVRPNATSELTLQEVDEFLERLSKLTKEEEQIDHFKSILKRCTADDLKMIIRLIKHDLRINAGPKHILGAVHDDAYTAFQVSRDLPAIIRRCLGISPTASTSSAATSPLAKSPKAGKVASLSLMTPVLPMLAEACKSVEMAMEKCPNGMLSEVKYDGERLQVHKMGSDFRYYSRSLKPVLPHKVNFLKEYIPKAFPQGDDLILDAEILLIDTRNGQPLPFGSLGVHKKAEFKDANVCLFVFDIIYYNGEPLMNRTMQQRRKLLEETMTPIPNRIMLSEIQVINDPKKLAAMIAKVFKLRLEGLVLKDVDSKYEPGKRHWLKIKKDYLLQGAMADSADLVVLGAWYGTGQKGGMMSVFLMGCYDPDSDIWVTVTKVHTGHDDATLAKLQTSLDMIKIGKDPGLVPRWLRANKPMIPDFVAKDPKKQPVWEITGAEFTNQGVHTADGISIRFPRVTRIRDDKDWETATNLHELRALFNRSAESVDYSSLLGVDASQDSVDNDDDDDTSKRKPKKPHGSDDEEPSSSKGNIKVEDAEDIWNEPDVKVKMQTVELDEQKPSKKRKSDVKRSPKKSPGKLITTFFAQNPVIKKEKKEKINSQSTEDLKEENRAEFYSFVGTDYIEYSAAGSPLNWIEGRKPPKYLPKDAKPISEPDEHKKRSRCLLTDVRVYLAKDLNRDRRKVVRRALKTFVATLLRSKRTALGFRTFSIMYNLFTGMYVFLLTPLLSWVNLLGAEILSKTEQSQATYVIHGSSRVPATILLEDTDVSKSARHVTDSWVNVTATRCKVQNAADYAVTLMGAYCSCPCPHRG